MQILAICVEVLCIMRVTWNLYKEILILKEEIFMKKIASVLFCLISMMTATIAFADSKFGEDIATACGKHFYGRSDQFIMNPDQIIEWDKTGLKGKNVVNSYLIDFIQIDKNRGLCKGAAHIHPEPQEPTFNMDVYRFNDTLYLKKRPRK